MNVSNKCNLVTMCVLLLCRSPLKHVELHYIEYGYPIAVAVISGIPSITNLIIYLYSKNFVKWIISLVPPSFIEPISFPLLYFNCR